MGMTVLYIAFAFVALWLLAEVLMQYKARLRWRLLAFAGFLGVVAGVVLPSVLVIAVGAIAFAVGQTLVTLSFRKGFVAGWALRKGKDGRPVRQEAPSRRRRHSGRGAQRQEPALEVTGLEYGSQDPAAAGAGADFPSHEDAGDRDDRNVFVPQPVPEDTGSYGIQSFAPQQPDATTAFASPFAADGHDGGQHAYPGPGQGQGGYDYTGGYPAGDQQVYAAYSDPYIGTGGAVSPGQPYDYPHYDPAQQQYSMDTPPGGVWVPQQRATDAAPQPYPEQDPQQQGYPYQGNGEYGQYRY
ncbi:hypothetical protein BX286_2204 [Streptomyces sp. 3211.6]|uniref:hypothetical protein n=1 Tax=Streptomyces TaxID=1883 RepID=UPI0009A49DB7|nr:MULTISPECIES: hypothetical protein [Streptomyces]RKT04256.1 hypothetical protein BX286_2204 [Streptomyces sp. 3211.6]RPF40139.1 hypothetical protein EDD96_3892 [Streptomyces sp. Ag109_G2-6]